MMKFFCPKSKVAVVATHAKHDDPQVDFIINSAKEMADPQHLTIDTSDGHTIVTVLADGETIDEETANFYYDQLFIINDPEQAQKAFEKPDFDGVNTLLYELKQSLLGLGTGGQIAYNHGLKPLEERWESGERSFGLCNEIKGFQ